MDYLYALQVARESAPDVVTAFFVFVSEYLMMLGPVLAAIIFWCIDKRTGIWMMLSFGWAQVATNLVKIIACIPRPWLLDGRLHVAEQAAGSATGYSFPSGHTATATSTFGAAGVYALNTGKLSAIGNVKRRHTALAIVFFVIVLLVAFSRNWLGAHTFKDVAVAMLLTAALMVALYFVLKLLDKRPKADVWVMVVMLAILAAAGVYAQSAASRTYTT